MHGLLPKFVTPQVVVACKDALFPKWVATDDAFKSCPTMPKPTLDAFEGDFAAFRLWAAKDYSWWSAAADFDQCEDYQRLLRGWQDKLERLNCDVPGPKIDPPEVPKATDILDTVKTVAVVSAVIGGVVLVAPLVWDFVAARRLVSRRRAR